MSPKTKQRKLDENDSEDSYSSDSSDESNDAYNDNEVIQVDFEGRNPMTSDFYGIRQLLQQLFLKSDINLSELTDLVTDQNFIGSVVIQSLGDDDDDDDDDSDDDENTSTIFGITTAINISKSQNHGCIEDIRKHLQAKCDQFANADDKNTISNALNDDTKQVGLLINERFINIPAQIAVPLLENLQKEIQSAAIKKEKYRFDWYMMMVKFNRKKATDSGKSKADDDNSEDIYSNEEEDIIDEYTDASFEYSAACETDSTLSGNWSAKDSTLVPYRKVVIFESSKLPFVIDAIKSLVCE